MSGFFGTTSTGSGSNANKSSSSSSGAGGWGSFLKQGLSTIESKLDTVLDMNVPIPGGSGGILTSFSPHANVLPSSITGSSTTKDTQPMKQQMPQAQSGSRDDTLRQDEESQTQDKSTEKSGTILSASMDKHRLKAKKSDQDIRTSFSETRTGGSMDDSSANIEKKEDESSVAIDPFTGMITTTQGVKRMSTPPVSGSGSATVTSAAAANRERLEQRMRGIFKKPIESPPATPTPTSAAARSPAASPATSARPSTSIESESQSQEWQPEDKDSLQTDTISVSEKDNSSDSKVSRQETPIETEKNDGIQALNTDESESANITGSLEDKCSIQESTIKTDTLELESTANSSQVNSQEDLGIKSSEKQTNESTIAKSGKLITPQSQPESPKEKNTEKSIDESESAAKESQLDLASSSEQDATKEIQDSTNQPDQKAAESSSEITTTMDGSNTLNDQEAVKDSDSPITPIQKQEVLLLQTDRNIDGSNRDLNENPLKRVLDQREEQLLKAMQQQSILLEKIRDLEDAKAADESLKNTKISGLEMIIENQKRDLEAARGSNIASQPKSIQKTLEEQRALLEDKDEQIKGLLAEGEILSKKEFKNLTAIKGLRTKNIEAEKLQMDTQKKLDRALSDYTDAQTKVSKLNDDNKQLNDAVKSLNDINHRQGKQISKLEVELAQLREDKINLQSGLERTRQELSEARKASADLSNQAHAAALERELKINEDLNSEIETLKSQHAGIELSLRQDIQELRVSLSNREEHAGEREDQLIMEIQNLQARLEQTDNDSYELQEAMDEARRPLLRQIEVLQNQQGVASRNWDRMEKSLTRRVSEAEAEANQARELERAAKDKQDGLKLQNSSFEARLDALRSADTQLRSEINITKKIVKEKEEEARQAQAELARERVNRERAVEEAKEDAERKQRLKHQAELEKLKQQIQKLQQKQGSSDTPINSNQSEIHLSLGPPPIRRPSSASTASASSPIISGVSRLAGGELTSIHDSALSPSSLDGMPPNLSRSSSSQTIHGTTASSAGLMNLGSGSTGQAVTIERLNTMVRQLEGQVTFLGEQVRGANKNKDELSNELVRVTMELEELQKQSSRVPALEQELHLLQDRHKAALEMLGERTEEVQELKADLVDVKEALRDQISELLGQLEISRKVNNNK
ncbi:hypothetical protein BGZ76_004257 [Entomortierella beljakovae]|nr:hypothetical protein BGZ76_004257 [Entomortierella beljakovae]